MFDRTRTDGRILLLGIVTTRLALTIAAGRYNLRCGVLVPAFAG
jgi:hypothetical protein